MFGLRRKFKFSAESLSENAKTISLSPWKLTILQCVTNKGQELLKNLAKKPKISDYHVPGVRSFYILLSNGAFLDFLLIYALLWQHFYVEIYAIFPQTFLLLECMTPRHKWKEEVANYVIFNGLRKVGADLKTNLWTVVLPLLYSKGRGELFARSNKIW